MWQTLLNLLTFHRDFASEAASGRLRPGTGRGRAAFCDRRRGHGARRDPDRDHRGAARGGRGARPPRRRDRGRGASGSPLRTELAHQRAELGGRADVRRRRPSRPPAPTRPPAARTVPRRHRAAAAGVDSAVTISDCRSRRSPAAAGASASPRRCPSSASTLAGRSRAAAAIGSGSRLDARARARAARRRGRASTTSPSRQPAAASSRRRSSESASVAAGSELQQRRLDQHAPAETSSAGAAAGRARSRAPSPAPQTTAGTSGSRLDQRRGVLALLLDRRAPVAIGRARAAPAAPVVGDRAGALRQRRRQRLPDRSRGGRLVDQQDTVGPSPRSLQAISTPRASQRRHAA